MNGQRVNHHAITIRLLVSPAPVGEMKGEIWMGGYKWCCGAVIEATDQHGIIPTTSPPLIQGVWEHSYCGWAAHANITRLVSPEFLPIFAAWINSLTGNPVSHTKKIKSSYFLVGTYLFSCRNSRKKFNKKNLACQNLSYDKTHNFMIFYLAQKRHNNMLFVFHWCN